MSEIVQKLVMSAPTLSHRLLLLDMIGSGHPLALHQMATLRPADWDDLNRIAREHRLEPLLHYQLGFSPLAELVPKQQRTAWAKAYHRTTMRMLAIQRQLLVIHDLLESAGISHVALKGAYLAWHAYPKPGMRPMRDLDLLVPRSQATFAFDHLLANGYMLMAPYGGDCDASLEYKHHLPPLRCPNDRVSIEIHGRLFHHDEQRSDIADLSEDEGFWKRVIIRETIGRRLRFLGPTDQLLHLIEHAVHGHQFDNGPLLFSDIAHLLDSHKLDWPLFWRLGEVSRCVRGAELVLALVQRYYPETSIIWRDDVMPAIPRSVLEAAGLASLRSWEHRQSTALVLRFHLERRSSSRVLNLWQRLVPGRNKMAMRHPVKADSPLIVFYYVKHWWRLVTERVPAVLETLFHRHRRDEVEGLAKVYRWVEGDN